jgi:hypothetical protein
MIFVRIALAVFVGCMTIVALINSDLIGTLVLGLGTYLLWPKGART